MRMRVRELNRLCGVQPRHKCDTRCRNLCQGAPASAGLTASWGAAARCCRWTRRASAKNMEAGKANHCWGERRGMDVSACVRLCARARAQVIPVRGNQVTEGTCSILCETALEQLTSEWNNEPLRWGSMATHTEISPMPTWETNIYCSYLFTWVVQYCGQGESHWLHY